MKMSSHFLVINVFKHNFETNSYSQLHARKIKLFLRGLIHASNLIKLLLTASQAFFLKKTLSKFLCDIIDHLPAQ